MAIKALQEEPKKCMYALDDFNDEDRKVTCDGCKEDCKYAKLNTMLDDALTKETKESRNERLDKKDYRERYKRIAQSESFKKAHEGISIGDTVPVEGEISEEPTIPDIVDEHFYEMLGEEPVSDDNNLRKASEEYLKVLSETPYNNTPITNAQTIVRELITFLDNPSKYNPNHIEEYVSEDLDEAAEMFIDSLIPTEVDTVTPFAAEYVIGLLNKAIEFGANWQKENLWKPADGDDLPVIDREVIALLYHCQVVFAHRPPEYWDGKDIVTDKVTRNYPKTYDKGGWNIPDVKWWLDIELPKEIEL